MIRQNLILAAARQLTEHDNPVPLYCLKETSHSADEKQHFQSKTENTMS